MSNSISSTKATQIAKDDWYSGLVIPGGLEAVKNTLLLYLQGCPADKKIDPAKVNYLDKFFEKKELGGYIDDDFGRGTRLQGAPLQIDVIDSEKQIYYLNTQDAKKNQEIKNYFGFKERFISARIEIQIDRPKAKPTIDFGEFLINTGGDPFIKFDMPYIQNWLDKDNIDSESNDTNPLMSFSDGLQMYCYLTSFETDKRQTRGNKIIFPFRDYKIRSKIWRKYSKDQYMTLRDNFTLYIQFRYKYGKNFLEEKFIDDPVVIANALALRNKLFRCLDGKRFYY